MKLALIILMLFLSERSISCGCGGPRNELSEDILRTKNIFIGIISEVNKEHLFHLSNGVGDGYKFINFDVLKSYKGLNRALLKVTVFDEMSNSSCEGLIGHKIKGDTILVFADEFNYNMLGSSLCGRHPRFSELSESEKIFIDTANWIDPRSKHKDPDAYIKNNLNLPVKIELRRDNGVGFQYYILTAILFFLLGFYVRKVK